MDSENTVDLWNVFAMLEPISEHPKRESFCFRDSFIATRTVCEDSGKVRDFANPAAVVFSLDFYGEVAHPEIVHVDPRCEKFAVQR